MVYDCFENIKSSIFPVENPAKWGLYWDLFTFFVYLQAVNARKVRCDWSCVAKSSGSRCHKLYREGTINVQFHGSSGGCIPWGQGDSRELTRTARITSRSLDTLWEISSYSLKKFNISGCIGKQPATEINRIKNHVSSISGVMAGSWLQLSYWQPGMDREGRMTWHVSTSPRFAGRHI